jgi:hypothetical protein
MDIRKESLLLFGGTAMHGSKDARHHTKKAIALEPDSTELNQALALSFCLSMIFSENRLPLFRIVLKRHAIRASA